MLTFLFCFSPSQKETILTNPQTATTKPGPQPSSSSTSSRAATTPQHWTAKRPANKASTPQPAFLIRSLACPTHSRPGLTSTTPTVNCFRFLSMGRTRWTVLLTLFMSLSVACFGVIAGLWMEVASAIHRFVPGLIWEGNSRGNGWPMECLGSALHFDPFRTVPVDGDQKR